MYVYVHYGIYVYIHRYTCYGFIYVLYTCFHISLYIYAVFLLCMCVCEHVLYVRMKVWCVRERESIIKKIFFLKNLPYPILSPCSPAGPSAIFALFMDEFGIYLINPT